MQHPTLMGMVESSGNRSDDREHFSDRSNGGESIGHELCGAGGIDVVHRDPQLPFELAAAMHFDDVGMVKVCGDRGFLPESAAEFLVRRLLTAG